MANPSHLEVALNGMQAIYRWNLSHIENDILDLSGADLSHADLSNADLRRADLRGAILRGANLIGANLQRALLRDADLSNARLARASLIAAGLVGAKLIRANAPRANFSQADLMSADLSEAILLHANFSGADLSAAMFRDAILGGTLFPDVCLSSVQHLDTARHSGPSCVGIDAILKSGKSISRPFMRGCGVSDDILNGILSFVGDGIEFYSCFISYSHDDEDFARQLCNKMQQSGMRVWFAPNDMRGGRKIHEQIFDAIRVFDKLLIILSQESMSSTWVATEIRRACRRQREERRQILFPIRITDMATINSWENFDVVTGNDICEELRAFHILDFSNWQDRDLFDQEFEKLRISMQRADEK